MRANTVQCSPFLFCQLLDILFAVRWRYEWWWWLFIFIFCVWLLIIIILEHEHLAWVNQTHTYIHAARNFIDFLRFFSHFKTNKYNWNCMRLNILYYIVQTLNKWLQMERKAFTLSLICFTMRACVRKYVFFSLSPLSFYCLSIFQIYLLCTFLLLLFWWQCI